MDQEEEITEEVLEVTGIYSEISVPAGEESKASQIVIYRNPWTNIGTWNVRTMLSTSKLEKIKLEIMR